MTSSFVSSRASMLPSSAGRALKPWPLEGSRCALACRCEGKICKLALGNFDAHVLYTYIYIRYSGNLSVSCTVQDCIPRPVVTMWSTPLLHDTKRWSFAAIKVCEWSTVIGKRSTKCILKRVVSDAGTATTDKGEPDGNIRRLGSHRNFIQYHSNIIIEMVSNTMNVCFQKPRNHHFKHSIYFLWAIFNSVYVKCD